MGAISKLSETELELMLEIWNMDRPATAAGLLETFAPRKGWKLSTVATLLNRLVEKGFLTKSLQGKANLFTPALTHEAYKRRETRSFLQTMHDNDLTSFVAALSAEDGVTPEQLAALRAWLERQGEDV